MANRGDIIVYFKEGSAEAYTALYLGMPDQFLTEIALEFWGSVLDVRKEYVIHMNKEDNKTGEIVLSECKFVFPQFVVYKAKGKSPRPPQKVVFCALSMLVNGAADVIDKGCEGFVTFCKYNEEFLLPTQPNAYHEDFENDVELVFKNVPAGFHSITFAAHNGDKAQPHERFNPAEKKSSREYHWDIETTGTPYAVCEFLNALNDTYTEYLTQADVTFIREYIKWPCFGGCIQSYLRLAGCDFRFPHKWGFIDVQVVSLKAYDDLQRKPFRKYQVMFDFVQILLHQRRDRTLPMEGESNRKVNITRTLQDRGFVMYPENSPA